MSTPTQNANISYTLNGREQNIESITPLPQDYNNNLNNLDIS